MAYVSPPARQEREARAHERAKRRAKDQKRRKCICAAYRWPHRPGGGLCRWPKPPAVSWRDSQAAEIAAHLAKFRAMHGEPTAEQMVDLVAMTTKPYRPYRRRPSGLRRQIARANGLHPIRDRAAIEEVLPNVLRLAKQLKSQYARVKYRNMEITEDGLRCNWQSTGPAM